MPSLLYQAVGLLVGFAYVASWAAATWLLLGRPREPTIFPALSVLLLGFGVPMILEDIRVVSKIRHPEGSLQDILRLVQFLWMASPAAVVCAFGICWLLRPRKRGRDRDVRG